jgi:hypothetical protein
MDKVFILRVLLSFFIAGGWIALSSVLAEKFGSKVGGFNVEIDRSLFDLPKEVKQGR